MHPCLVHPGVCACMVLTPLPPRHSLQELSQASSAVTQQSEVTDD